MEYSASASAVPLVSSYVSVVLSEAGLPGAVVLLLLAERLDCFDCLDRATLAKSDSRSPNALSADVAMVESSDATSSTTRLRSSVATF